MFFIVLLFFAGISLLAYLVMCIMVPVKGATRDTTAANRLRLWRSDRKVAGVCEGLGEFLDIDPVVFHAILVVLAFLCGLGIILYIALWLIMPQAPAVPTADRDWTGSVSK